MKDLESREIKLKYFIFKLNIFKITSGHDEEEVGMDLVLMDKRL